MFERYTEKARRVIFFARYEASTMGSAEIETEHLLLGILNENKDILQPNTAGTGLAPRGVWWECGYATVFAQSV